MKYVPYTKSILGMLVITYTMCQKKKIKKNTKYVHHALFEDCHAN